MAKKKEKTTSATTTNSTAVQTPNVPDWIQSPYKDFASQVGGLASADPNSFVTGPSGLQQQAFSLAAGLGTAGSNYYDAAKGLIGNVAGAGANLAAPATMANTSLIGGQANVTAPTIAKTDGATATLASAPTIDNPLATWEAKIAALTNAAKTKLGDVSTVDAQSLLTNLQNYMDPYNNAVVNTTLSGLDDNAARAANATRAAGLTNGALTGSRFGVKEAIQAAEAAKLRTATEAKLHSDAFNTAAGLSEADTARRQEAGIFNSGAKNTSTLQQGQMDQATELANAAASNENSMFNTTQQNTASSQNAGAQNARDLALADMAARTSIQNSQAGTSVNLANAAQQATQAIQQAQMLFDAGKINAAQYNDVLKTNAAALNDNSRFNADAINKNGQFNAGQQDGNLDRILAAAGLFGNMGTAANSNQTANVGLIGSLGATQRDIANEQAQAPLTTLGTIGGLLGQIPTGAFSGQTTNVNGSTTGNSTTTSSDPLGSYLKLLQTAASAASAAGGA